MNSWRPFSEQIRLHVPDQISAADAQRQTETAREILKRLADQPGVILADEVGMGKTFVALAVAASAALADPEHRPVIIMVPSALHEKWPGDFDLFREQCLDQSVRNRVRGASASTAVELLKLLDDPPERRCSLIFLTHGAMHRGLTDGWVKLAVIQRVLKGRHHTAGLRKSLARCMGSLLRMEWLSRDESFWADLLSLPPKRWMNRVNQQHPERLGDDPVPEAVVQALQQLSARDCDEIYDDLKRIPKHQTITYKDRVANARRALQESLRSLWSICLHRLSFKLPLLVMDEAHHLKNSETKLAGLFQSCESLDDAEEITKSGGALGGVFERMLFLTATPFQLGHSELCSVLTRFEGVAWDTAAAPRGGREKYRQGLQVLQERLDAAQRAALGLDAAWGRLRFEDLVANGQAFADGDAWWSAAENGTSLTRAGEEAVQAVVATRTQMQAAQEALRPWVLRHLRPRQFEGIRRRQPLPGRAILLDAASGANGNGSMADVGIEVSGPALLPFLLAARATFCNPEQRPVFAEGLASSYEAFRNTRHRPAESADGDDDPIDVSQPEGAAKWYLQRLEDVLGGSTREAAAHPKVAATARQAVEAWQAGEKVLVFCHYIRTGHVLRSVISEMIAENIQRAAAAKLGCAPHEAADHLQRLGERFDKGGSARDVIDVRIAAEIELHGDSLREYRDQLIDIAGRFLRTPSFLVRFFPLAEARHAIVTRGEQLPLGVLDTILEVRDGSGLQLRDVLNSFFEFLRRSAPENRKRYVEAIGKIQTGVMQGREVLESFDDDEQPDEAARWLPNVRLVNGSTKPETRQRLMRTFNSPFFPEILVASNVMAEGVDLHRFCRYIIHHDLCWNPSTLEQRTGRVDRIGAKVESSRRPIQLFLPYLAATQDEKMYRVVMDRERWFSVVMGEQLRVDARSTEQLAERIPLPADLAHSLAFRLEVVP